MNVRPRISLKVMMALLRHSSSEIARVINKFMPMVASQKGRIDASMFLSNDYCIEDRSGGKNNGLGKKEKRKMGG